MAAKFDFRKHYTGVLSPERDGCCRKHIIMDESVNKSSSSKKLRKNTSGGGADDVWSASRIPCSDKTSRGLPPHFTTCPKLIMMKLWKVERLSKVD
jgi:hypothetical protein